MENQTSPLTSSFRDPSGFLFTKSGVLYRQVNKEYQPVYEKLMSSGLYQALVKKGWLISHEEKTDVNPAQKDISFLVIKPEKVDFISYPYEWSFSQLKRRSASYIESSKTGNG